MAEPPGPDAAMQAAIIAGYVERPGHSLRRQAAALLKDRGVLDALKELGSQEILAMIQAALQALRDTTDIVHSKDRLKAAMAVIDRFNPVVQKVEMKAEVVNREQVTLDHLRHLLELGASRDVLVREFGPGGLPRYMAMLESRKDTAPVLELEPVEERLEERLEDLL